MSFKPPKEFNPGNNPTENWMKWRNGFENYMLASELNSKPVAQQRAILKHVIGEIGNDLISTMEFSNEDDILTVETILQAISSHYKPYKNTTYMRYLFFTETQKESQTIDEFVTALKIKVKDCEFGNLTDDLVRDRLICGIRESSVRERLLKEQDLSLAMAIGICRADETTKSQMKIMAKPEIEISAVSKTMKKEKEFKYKEQNYQVKKFQCRRCGQKHKPKECPAWNKTCEKCKIRGHLASQCRTGKRKTLINEIYTNEDTNSDSDFIGAIHIAYKKNYYDLHKKDDIKVFHINNQTKDWFEFVEISGENVKMKMDSGSQANIISYDIYSKLSNKPKLSLTNRNIISYSSNEIENKGICELLCKMGKNTHKLEFFVTVKNSIPLLGLEAMIKFGLVNMLTSKEGECHSIDQENAATELINEYEDVFNGLGKVNTKYTIQLKDGAIPTISGTRKIPYAFKGEVKKEIDRMTTLGILERVEEATDWVHPIVLVRKPNGKIRICMDPRNLNIYIKREHFQLPTVDEIFAELSGAKYFTVLDASTAFLQVPLDEESSKLCTITTPFGRYRYKRLPYGLKSSSEVFQKAINKVFDGIKGIYTYMDDILITGSTLLEHNKTLKLVLEKARENNLRLNKDKMQLAVKKIRYLGHIVTENGISIDPSKVNAIKSMKTPANKNELQRFLGILKYVSKFVPNISEKTHTLRELLKEKNVWTWGTNEEKCFNLLKDLVTTTPILSIFNPNKEITLSVDASPYGLGSVLLQEGRPVAYASSSLTPTQMRYAHIEKELLAIVTACEHFHYYVYGQEFTVQTDHKPLIGIVKKPLDSLTPRIQRLSIRLLRYQPNLIFVPGKEMFVADALSRDPLKKMVDTSYLEGEAAKVCTLITATSNKLTEIIRDTELDETLRQVKQYITTSWPESKNKVMATCKTYWDFKDELIEQDGLIFKGNRLVTPINQRQKILTLLHSSHQGINSCLFKAKRAYYWPNMSNDIQNFVEKCRICNSHSRSNLKQPIMSHPVKELPWEKIGIDFVQINDENYLVVIDYHSKFVIVKLMKRKTAKDVISKLKGIFRMYGIPMELMSDNGPPFDSGVFGIC